METLQPKGPQPRIMPCIVDGLFGLGAPGQGAALNRYFVQFLPTFIAEHRHDIVAMVTRALETALPNRKPAITIYLAELRNPTLNMAQWLIETSKKIHELAENTHDDEVSEFLYGTVKHLQKLTQLENRVGGADMTAPGRGATPKAVSECQQIAEEYARHKQKYFRLFAVPLAAPLAGLLAVARKLPLVSKVLPAPRDAKEYTKVAGAYAGAAPGCAQAGLGPLLVQHEDLFKKYARVTACKPLDFAQLPLLRAGAAGLAAHEQTMVYFLATQPATLENMAEYGGKLAQACAAAGVARGGADIVEGGGATSYLLLAALAIVLAIIVIYLYRRRAAPADAAGTRKKVTSSEFSAAVHDAELHETRAGSLASTNTSTGGASTLSIVG